MDGIRLPTQRPDARRVDWLYTVGVEDFVTEQRNELIELLASDGIETRPVFYPLHLMPPYISEPVESFPVSEQLGAQGISLPTHTLLSDADVDTICDAFAQRVDDLRR